MHIRFIIAIIQVYFLIFDIIIRIVYDIKYLEIELNYCNYEYIMDDVSGI